MRDCWQHIVPDDGSLTLDKLLVGVTYIGSILAIASLEAAQEWEAQCREMEALLLEQGEIKVELATPGPDDDLRERFVTLNKELEALEESYKQNDAMLELLVTRKSKREQ